MTNSRTDLRIAIAQQPMHWTTVENVERIVAALALAAEQGASLCAFPELALTACTTVMCREVDDLEVIAAQLHAEPVDLIFWPSLVGNPPGTVHPSPEDTADLGYFKRTAVLAQRLNAHVVQSNWPQALNTPDATYLGESRVYAPDGEILLMLPRDRAGVGVFTLGERALRWTPLPA